MIYSQPLAQPLFNSSVYSFKDLDTYELAVEAKNTEFIYARDGHPNLVSLCNQLNALENTTDGIVTGKVGFGQTRPDHTLYLLHLKRRFTGKTCFPPAWAAPNGLVVRG